MTAPVKKKLNRTTLFTKVRKSVFNGKLMQTQVDGINVILDKWEKSDLIDVRWLAYILATAHHETAHTFRPISEYGEGKGRKYGIPDPVTGQIYYGRGFVQLTWKANYKTFSDLLGIDLVNNPDMANYTDVATAILFKGMIGGIFTGKKLADYFTPKKSDWYNARRIVNGTDCADIIALDAIDFYKALT
jgi:putative chitinase